MNKRCPLLNLFYIKKIPFTLGFTKNHYMSYLLKSLRSKEFFKIYFINEVPVLLNIFLHFSPFWRLQANWNKFRKPQIFKILCWAGEDTVIIYIVWELFVTLRFLWILENMILKSYSEKCLEDQKWKKLGNHVVSQNKATATILVYVCMFAKNSTYVRLTHRTQVSSLIVPYFTISK